ncbi:carbohydrate porin [Mesorhizobium sp. KR1-2]|uniref:carbohydrate porin n=1 Tax=Mesorhizobium sp. KR1-2 TaxID=3156609 RepID=UPI0032B5A3BE
MLFSSMALVALRPVLAHADAASSSAPQSIWEWGTLTGDWGGHRTALKKKGIEFTINYIGEIMNVVSGGRRRGTTYEGQLNVTVDVDLAKLIGWNGTRAQAIIYQLHDVDDRDVEDNVGSLADPSDIDALATTRLFTAWLEHDLNKSSSLRIGQLAADSDFIIAPTSVVLMNSTFGWPALNMADLPSGGPAYPLATPGARLSWKDKHWSFLTAIYSGNPAGSHCMTNPQACDRYGLTFSFSGGALIFAEAGYSANAADHDAGLAATYKLGGWYHTAEFPQLPFGLNGADDQAFLAATPISPHMHRGNWGIYAVADQALWRSGSRALSVFLRGQVVPADRNLVSWQVDGGFGIKGPFKSRSKDTLTVGLAYSRVSNDAIALDRERVAAGGTGPTRSGELVLEVNYVAQISPWWSLQPDFQYIVRPGGGAANPANPSESIPNATVIGLRSTIKF